MSVNLHVATMSMQVRRFDHEGLCQLQNRQCHWMTGVQPLITVMGKCLCKQSQPSTQLPVIATETQLYIVTQLPFIPIQQLFIDKIAPMLRNVKQWASPTAVGMEQNSLLSPSPTHPHTNTHTQTRTKREREIHTCHQPRTVS